MEFVSRLREMSQYSSNQYESNKRKRGLSYYYRKTAEIFEMEYHYMEQFVLGMTDGIKIWLKKNLGYMRPLVLAHELEHVNDMSASEETVQQRALYKLGMTY